METTASLVAVLKERYGAPVRKSNKKRRRSRAIARLLRGGHRHG